jgi:NADH:ubiquinone oxidoreductase subunit 4 (subunit M)
LVLVARIRTFPMARIVLARRVVFRATYSIWLFSRTSYGLWSLQLGPSQDLTLKEGRIAAILLLITFGACFYGSMFLRLGSGDMRYEPMRGEYRGGGEDKY